MRIRTLAAVLAAFTLPLTACGGSSDPKEPEPADKPAASQGVDCEDENLSQEEWIDNCQPDPPDTDLKLGESYTWTDGVKTTVTKIERITGPYQQGDTKPSAKETLFRVHIAFSNGADIPVKLDEFSTVIDGAINGGEAAMGTYQAGEEPIAGRLAPGAKATKTDENIIEKRYGDKVVVTIQRGMEVDEPSGYPEFTGAIS
ncbi:hypothetical protein OG453_44325 [Streptomyces sp. NBC_01381]|uniref:hypothetical protein n=1 Tax=Streptomyces sp. NBC_01381 TaxID=2903845 RepID=UPI00225AC493|nr:hypothetical protein [Streptomyces sp. NBC_01381]MCX4673585.1 hypothetical protein [Streptomyces sp. NBC_01381]